MNKKDLKVGQTVLKVLQYNQGGYKKEKPEPIFEDAVITKIGLLYFYVKNGVFETKVFIENGSTESQSLKVYLDKESYYVAIEQQRLSDENRAIVIRLSAGAYWNHLTSNNHLELNTLLKKLFPDVKNQKQ